MTDDGLLQYFGKIGLDVQDFLNGMSKSQQGVLQFARDVTVTMNATMMIFDRVMAYGQQFVNLANQASEFVSVIDRLSVTTGMSNEELQRFSNVARYADSDIGSLAAMVNKLQINLRDQGEQGEKARKILDAMGVSYRNADGSLRSSSELFPEVIQGLKGLESSADRVTAANVLVGRGYQELAGYMNMSKEEMEGYFNSANVLTDEQQQKLREYEGACKDLDATMQGLSMTAGSELAPAFKEWADFMNEDLLQKGGAIETFFSNLNDFLTLAARGFHILGVEAGQAWKVAHGDIEGAIQDQRDLESWVQSKQTEDALAASGYREGMHMEDGKWVKNTSTTGPGTSLPYLGSESSTKSSTASSLNDMRQWAIDLQRLYEVTIPDQQKEITDLQKEYNAIADKSTQAAKELNRKLIDAQLDLKEMTVKADEFNRKLAAAALPPAFLEAMKLMGLDVSGVEAYLKGSASSTTSSKTPSSSNTSGGYTTQQMADEGEGQSPEIDPNALIEMADLREKAKRAKEKVAYYTELLYWAKIGDWQTAAQRGISWDPWQMPAYEQALEAARAELAGIQTRYSGLLGMTGNYSGVPLAAGGIAFEPIHAIIGDNPRGPEAVIPLDQIGEVAAKIGVKGGGGDTFIIHAENNDPRETARKTVQAVSEILAIEAIKRSS